MFLIAFQWWLDELSYILSELFNVSKGILFSRFQKVSSVVLVFKNVGERFTVKN